MIICIKRQLTFNFHLFSTRSFKKVKSFKKKNIKKIEKKNIANET